MLFTRSTVLALLAATGLASAFNATYGPLDVKRAHHAHAQHVKRFSGRATWYDVGLGACGRRNVASDFIVALNDKQFGSGYPGPNCFRRIRITYEGKSADATIMDMCPGCPFGALDLSKGLFTHFEPLGTGVFYMNWDFIGGGGGDDDNDNGGGNNNNNKDNDDDDKKEEERTSRRPDPPRTSTRRRTTTRTRTSTRASRTSTSSSSQESETESASTSATISIYAAAATPTNNRRPKGGNITQQWQLIANLGAMASFGRSSDKN